MIEYQNINQELKIRVISASGQLIYLDDGSRWEIIPSKKTHPSMWSEGDTVYVFDPGYKKRIPSSEYKIKNVTRDEVAEGFVVLIKRDGS